MIFQTIEELYTYLNNEELPETLNIDEMVVMKNISDKFPESEIKGNNLFIEIDIPDWNVSLTFYNINEKITICSNFANERSVNNNSTIPIRNKLIIDRKTIISLSDQIKKSKSN